MLGSAGGLCAGNDDDDIVEHVYSGKYIEKLAIEFWRFFDRRRWHFVFYQASLDLEGVCCWRPSPLSSFGAAFPKPIQFHT